MAQQQRFYPSRLGQSHIPLRNSEAYPQATVAFEDRAIFHQLIDELITYSLVLADDWHNVDAETREWILSAVDQCEFIDRLAKHGLLTEYQAGRIKSGAVYGLVLGNYRVLDRLGSGGMGIVFKAEHTLLRRIVAVKVLPMSRDQDHRMLRRFQSEMRAIAALQHPNIVAATDAGQVFPAEPNLPVLHYLVMEYVQGQDLEELVSRDGPMDPTLACDLIHQVASALAEAHHRNLVHRDIKPSNVLVNEFRQAKLLDFGLAREFGHQLTEQGCVLGTIDYMSPEQAQDPSSVDIRADIYSLGATLYWCLTGKVPFPSQSTASQQIARRLRDNPPSLRARRPELPVELDAVIARMMAVRPDDRYQTPQELMRALVPFLRKSQAEADRYGGLADAVWALAESDSRAGDRRRVLIVDDDTNIVDYCRAVLAPEMDCVAAHSAQQALEIITREKFDLVLLDLILPDRKGTDLLSDLRQLLASNRPRFILMSGFSGPDDVNRMLASGADDFVPKPFGAVLLRARVRLAIMHHELARRAESLSLHVRALSTDLERTLESRLQDSRQARAAFCHGLVAIFLARTNKSPAEISRMRQYARALAEEASTLSDFSSQINSAFIADFEQFLPLADIGLATLPDHIIHKVGLLEPEERIIWQSHTVIGAELLQQMIEGMGPFGEFLQPAVRLARSHHEQFHGGGYPDHLVGDAIPLEARMFSLIETYESLRTRRANQPALPHPTACQVLFEGSEGKFDPRLLQAFRKVAPRFSEIYQRTQE
jgi:response regulator RpfG family c-di-GMP phosphodiesterase